MMRFYFLFFSIFPLLLTLVCNLFFFKLDTSNVLAIICWYYVFVLMGWCIYPMSAWVFAEKRKYTWAFGKVLGFLFLGYYSWMVPFCGVHGFTRGLMISGLIVLILAGIAVIFFVHGPDRYVSMLRADSREIIIGEVIFLFVFFTLLVLSSFKPELMTGEKTMDASLLNYLVRRDRFPIVDPWLPPFTMKYYYWGYYFYAGIIKLVGIKSSVGYLVCIATVGGLLISCVYSFLRWVSKSTIVSITFTILIVMGGTLRSVSQYVLEGKPLHFDYFWSSSRVLINSYFFEFPFWSFIFLDLHPHVMTYPFAFAMLVLSIPFMERTFYKGKKSIFLIFIFGLAHASLLALNGWDFIIFSGYLVFLFFWSVDLKKGGLHVLTKQVPCFVGIGLAGVMFSWPMISLLRSGRKLSLGFADNGFNGITQYSGVFGSWWLIAIPVLLLFIFTSVLNKKVHLRNIDKKIVFLVLAVISFFIFLFCFRGEVGWAAFVTAMCYLIIAAFYSMAGYATLTARFISFLLCIISVYILLSEHMILHDRYNTFFKVFNNLWIWTGIVVALFLRWYKRVFYKQKNVVAFLANTFTLSAICIPVIGTVLLFVAISSYIHYGQKTPVLDMLSNYKKVNEGEYKAIEWINENIVGTPIILEHSTERSFTSGVLRFSKNTGLPVFVGWPRHLVLRGGDYMEAGKRLKQMKYVYNSVETADVYNFLRLQKIRYIVVGKLERLSYSMKGLRKFEIWDSFFKPVVKYDGITIYEVVE